MLGEVPEVEIASSVAFLAEAQYLTLEDMFGSHSHCRDRRVGGQCDRGEIVHEAEDKLAGEVLSVTGATAISADQQLPFSPQGADEDIGHIDQHLAVLRLSAEGRH
jgi:hypothetical protein